MRYAIRMQPTANPAQQTPDTPAELCPLAGDQPGILPAEHHSVYCPTCNSRLQDSRCKLICRNCGYFLSCADFY